MKIKHLISIDKRGTQNYVKDSVDVGHDEIVSHMVLEAKFNLNLKLLSYHYFFSHKQLSYSEKC